MGRGEGRRWMMKYQFLSLTSTLLSATSNKEIKVENYNIINSPHFATFLCNALFLGLLAFDHSLTFYVYTRVCVYTYIYIYIYSFTTKMIFFTPCKDTVYFSSHFHKKNLIYTIFIFVYKYFFNIFLLFSCLKLPRNFLSPYFLCPHISPPHFSLGF